MNPPWKIKRSRYILEYYGSWNNAHNQGLTDPSTGITSIILPPSVMEKIINDPECYQPKKRSWFGTFTTFTNYTL